MPRAWSQGRWDCLSARRWKSCGRGWRGCGGGRLAGSEALRKTLGWWVILYALVGAQMSWLLRPFFNSTDVFIRPRSAIDASMSPKKELFMAARASEDMGGESELAIVPKMFKESRQARK